MLRGKCPQSEIAPLFGVKQAAYGNWERGEKEPNIATIATICGHYKCSSDWLLGLVDERTGHLHVVADAPVPYGQSPPTCASCAAKDATIAQLSASVASLSESLRQLSGSAHEKKRYPALRGAP